MRIPLSPAASHSGYLISDHPRPGQPAAAGAVSAHAAVGLPNGHHRGHSGHSRRQRRAIDVAVLTGRRMRYLSAGRPGRLERCSRHGCGPDGGTRRCRAPVTAVVSVEPPTCRHLPQPTARGRGLAGLRTAVRIRPAAPRADAVTITYRDGLAPRIRASLPDIRSPLLCWRRW